MAFLDIVPDLALWQWVTIVVGLVVYLAVAAVGFTFLEDNVSNKAAERWAQTFALPIYLLLLGLVFGIAALGWPWRWVQQARFNGIFGFWPAKYPRSYEQEVVDKKLADLAAEMSDAFTAQEEARRKRSLSVNVDLKDVDSEVRETKKAFWRAHALAKKFNFDVRERHSDYRLPSWALIR